MGDKTAIEWTDATWTPIRARRKSNGKVGFHCEHVSEACRNCYAEVMNKRGLFTGLPYARQFRDEVEIFLGEVALLAPLKWKKPRKIFVCSMTDLFADFVPDEMIDKIFAVMAGSPQHTFQVLTKRPERMRAYMSALVCGGGYRPYVRRPGWKARDPRDGDRLLLLDAGQTWPLRNVWLGVTVENQKTADERVPHLLATPAAIRFLSCEPLLGPIDLRQLRIADEPHSRTHDALSGISSDTPWGYVRSGIADPMSRGKLDLVITGGESGPHARPMHPDWARSLRDQCVAAGVPFFFKQWGEYLPVGQWLPGYGQVHGATAVKRGRMKLHFGGTPKQPPKHAFAERGVWFASTPDGRLAFRVGKKRAGRLLDGREWSEFPPRDPGK